MLEVTAPGLVQGFTDSSGLDIPSVSRLHGVDCWDNVHWWGMRATPNTYISAPGAFHAAHIHWRCGRLNALADIDIGEPGRPLPVLPFDVGAHFNPGIPLVDPQIPWQTLQIAVTKNAKRLDPAQTTLTSLTESEWESLFETNDNLPPVKIADGDDIVLWYSTEVLRKVGLATPIVAVFSQGTVFLHGIFFAHDDEVCGLLVRTTGTEHRPRSGSAIEKRKSGSGLQAGSACSHSMQP